MTKHFITFLFVACFALQVVAQGWERIVSGSAQDAGSSVVRTPDGGYALTGYALFSRILVTKVDADGKVQWFKTLNNNPTFGSGEQIVVLQDGSLMVAGWLRTGLGVASDGFLARLTADGTLLWTKTFGAAGREEIINDMILLPNGNVVLGGTKEQANSFDDFWLLEVNIQGTLISERTYGKWEKDEKASGIARAQNGDLILAGEVKDIIDNDVQVVRISSDGNTVWAAEYGLDFVPNAPSSDRALDVAIANDGNIVICGVTNASITGGGGLIMKISADGSAQPIWYTAIPSTPINGMERATNGGFLFTGLKEISSTFEDVYLLKTDENGGTIWSRTVGKGGTDFGNQIINTIDGGTLTVGSSTPNLVTQETYAYLVKTDALGRVYTNTIVGNVFQDLNNTCTKQVSEPALVDWIVKIVSADNTRYAATDNQGNFSVTVDTGTHTVSLLPANGLWNVCQSEYVLNMPMPIDTAEVMMPVRPSIICPNNVIEIQTDVLRNCAENIFQIKYCNQGTFPSPDTYIEVSLDAALTYTGSSLAPSSISNKTIRWSIGYLEKGQCGQISMKAALRCDSIVIGQAHCVTAHIYPDTICTPSTNWDGAIIRADAECAGEQIRLKLKNRGAGDMLQAQDFIVIEDVLEIASPAAGFKLNAGQDSTVFVTPANGKTYRVIASQSPGYPGESYPTAAIEGCKTDSITTNISLGYYTMFPSDDADAFVSTLCLESISNQEALPNFLLSGHPKGYDFNHYISSSTDLTYVIRFSNDGSDTVKTVVVRDTLPMQLDPATVLPGASSHPYQFEVYGNGIVSFILSQTDLLPDGSAPEARTSGFVSFRVAQKPSLPCETKITNRAAVTLGYRAPKLTNEVFYTVCTDFITVSTDDDLPNRGAKVTIYPNPFTEWVVFDLENTSAKHYTLQLFDLEGKLQLVNQYDHNTFRLAGAQVPIGVHVYQILGDGKLLTSGKLVKGPQ
jgi:hypothetical protein